MTVKTKLTDYEVVALDARFNLTDGHAYYNFAPYDDAALDAFSNFFPANFSQFDCEKEFFELFCSLAEQTPNHSHTLFNFSASISIEIIANYLRLHKMSVALIEPIFDGLADIVNRHKIPRVPLKEKEIQTIGLLNTLKKIQADALFLVIPNNPTGFVFSENEFATIVEFCKNNDKLLILDFSFRFFCSDLLQWNQYDLLDNANIQYIAFEDTGKTWPTFELKVSPMIADNKTFPEIKSIYRDIFLCHSPVILSLLTRYLKVSHDLGISRTITKISDGNRKLLRQVLDGLPLRPLGLPYSNVEWLNIDTPMTDVELENELRQRGVFIVPGRHFFWSDPNQGKKFVRVALMRDTEMFSSAMSHLAKILPPILK